ncbi:cleavage and polyadenylation specificity factor subunit 6-like [Sphaeramia orbicularis]|uniref:cleavage and polyadenylation specificity factor subunit 6-like n=1 Tax=Sphaeramia orbicularis TaxID=375764 RepID=UPI00117EA3D7|nr:cleavage and polyadenylation specificity factor subunit 6-like [Sphaeramia orbicularis]
MESPERASLTMCKKYFLLVVFCLINIPMINCDDHSSDSDSSSDSDERHNRFPGFTFNLWPLFPALWPPPPPAPATPLPPPPAPPAPQPNTTPNPGTAGPPTTTVPRGDNR